MGPSTFDDRTVTLDAPEQLAELASVLGSRTRLAIVSALVHSPGPLHINELARRVGVDASPVRTHLELLVRAGVAREVAAPTGRERRFETRLRTVRVTLEGVNRPAAPEKGREPPRDVLRLQKKLAALEKQMATLDAKARAVKRDVDAAWARKADAKP